MTRTLLRRGRRVSTLTRRAPARSLRAGDKIKDRAGNVRTVARVVHVPQFVGHRVYRITTWYREQHPDGRGQDGTGWMAHELVRVVRRAAA